MLNWFEISSENLKGQHKPPRDAMNLIEVFYEVAMVIHFCYKELHIYVCVYVRVFVLFFVLFYFIYRGCVISPLQVTHSKICINIIFV